MADFHKIEKFLLLVGYIPLITAALLLANGVAWLSQSDTTGHSIVDSRMLVLAGFSAIIFLTSFLPKTVRRFANSFLAIFGCGIFLLGLLVTLISMPELSGIHLLLFVGPLLAGIGLGLSLASGIYRLKLMEQKQFILFYLIAIIFSMLLYFVVNSCTQILGIALTLALPCISAVLFYVFAQKSDKPSVTSTKKRKGSQETVPFLRQFALSLFAMAVAVELQENYLLSQMAPADIYTVFASAFVFVMVALIALVVKLIPQTTKRLGLRALHVASIAVLGSSLTPLLFPDLPGLLIGVCCALPFLFLVLYGCLFLMSWLSNTDDNKKTVTRALTGALCLVGSIFGVSHISHQFFYGQATLVILLAISLVFLVQALYPTQALVLFEGSSNLQEPVASQAVARKWESACHRVAQEKGLSPREEEVLCLLAQGYKNKNISAKLCISDSTVRTHIRNFYTKMEVHSKAEAVAVLDGALEITTQT